ncbi:hypothetical protein GCM10027605_58690 [Micromonospora zhanjiangensis]
MPPEESGFRRGRASVGPPRQRTEEFPAAPHEPTGTGWPDAGQSRPRPPAGSQLRQLRRGSEWSTLGLLFSFVCWGVWAISSRGNLTSPVAAFLLTLLVAAGLFALSRLLGRVVLERQLGRVRRSARGAHLVAGVFLVGAGVAYLRQTEWVITAWNWVTSL